MATVYHDDAPSAERGTIFVSTEVPLSAIEVEHLTKHYQVHRRPAGFVAAVRSLFSRKFETVHAVEDLSFQIQPGERVGFLGPNGAGKTTTLKVLSGLLHPTAGVVRVAGHNPRKREVEFLKKITLVMGQKQQLLWDLPPVETFAMNRALYDVPRDAYQEVSKELYELLDLELLATKPTRQLSLGERMKCELAAALLHRPKLLFLDEPTIGLDVSMQASMRGFIREYNERHGATVLLTSHYMEDVAALCPRVIVIDHGRLIYDGDLKALTRKVNPDKLVTVRLAAPVAPKDAARLGQVIEHDEARLVLRVTQAELGGVVSALLATMRVADLSVEDPPLVDVMRQLFAESRSGSNGNAMPAEESLEDRA
ncbi:MAG: ATP-binding cassette domain-containing protein [Deltaproteobacteria bacterium]|nr:ATP-binding cassette domain-containing protein [Deltaproteobacteria bacterium]